VGGAGRRRRDGAGRDGAVRRGEWGAGSGSLRAQANGPRFQQGRPTSRPGGLPRTGAGAVPTRGADERLHLDLHAVARRPLQILLALPEHDAAHLGVLVLQNEIRVSRLGHGEVGYLARDPKQRIATLEQVPDTANEGGNAENLRGGMRGNPRQSLFSEHVPIVTYPQLALRRCSPL